MASLSDIRGGKKILSPTPEFNTEIMSLFSGITTAFHSRMAATREVQGQGFSIVFFIVIVAAFIGLYIWYGNYVQTLETPSNISRVVRDAIAANDKYSVNNPNRVGLRDYLKRLNIGDDQTAFTNFYISTVNATGFFFPATNGVFSPAAARLAVLGGARGFVFDIWPDLSQGAGFAPSVQIVEPGSLWRRISLNSLPFSLVLKAVVNEALEVAGRPGYYDPVVLYLRFRGKPRSSTYESTYNVLQDAINKYRLDTSFNSCRGQDRLFRTPIQNLMRKIVVVSNTRAEGTNLGEYINIGPSDGFKQEYLPSESRDLSMDAKTDAIRKIKQTITFVAPYSETPQAESNDWDFTPSMDIGIQCIAMNFWKQTDKLKDYLSDAKFGKQSFLIKPPGLRFVVETLPKSASPPNFNWGEGEAAGKPHPPRSLTIPGQ